MFGYVRLMDRYFDWEFDWPNSRHIFLRAADTEKHINFYLNKYFVAQKEADCIPVLKRGGHICLPVGSG